MKEQDISQILFDAVINLSPENRLSVILDAEYRSILVEKFMPRTMKEVLYILMQNDYLLYTRHSNSVPMHTALFCIVREHINKLAYHYAVSYHRSQIKESNSEAEKEVKNRHNTIKNLISCLEEHVGSEFDGDYLMDVVGLTEEEVKLYFDEDYKQGGLHEVIKMGEGGK